MVSTNYSIRTSCSSHPCHATPRLKFHPPTQPPPSLVRNCVSESDSWVNLGLRVETFQLNVNALEERFICALGIWLQSKYHAYIWDYGSSIFSSVTYHIMILWRTEIQIQKSTLPPTKSRINVCAVWWNTHSDCDTYHIDMYVKWEILSFRCCLSFSWKIAPHDTPVYPSRTQTSKQRTRSNKYLLRLNQKKEEEEGGRGKNK